jgi:hypothetical protein
MLKLLCLVAKLVAPSSGARRKNIIAKQIFLG